MEPYEYSTLFEFESSYWWYQGLHAILLDILHNLKVGIGSTILDAGCGTGKNLVNIATKITPHVFGFDFSPHATLFWSQRNLDQICTASINQIPFRDNTFDAVLSIDVLESDEVDEAQAYRELWRVVKSSGFIILVVPAYQWLLTRSHHEAVHASRRYNQRTLRSLLSVCPVEVIRFTHLFASVFPAVAVYRLVLRYFSRNSGSLSPRSELHHLPSFLNKVLFQMVYLERRLLKRMDMPFGSSMLAVVRKAS